MAKAPRRTPEQLAAHYQRKANAARAKAAKAAKDERMKLELELGRAAIAAGLGSPDQVTAAAQKKPASLSAADRVMVDAFTLMFGPQGGLIVSGGKKHWDALTSLVKLTSEQRDILFAHWEAKGWPMSAAPK
jgi:hypothetical protein